MCVAPGNENPVPNEAVVLQSSRITYRLVATRSFDEPDGTGGGDPPPTRANRVSLWNVVGGIAPVI